VKRSRRGTGILSVRGGTPKEPRYVIGLTGGLGSGKSTVLKEFRRLGAVTSDADEIARRVVRPGGPAFAPVVRLLGRGILRPGGTLDRAEVAARVFRRPSLRRKLEGIIHPLVRREMEALIRRIPRGVIVLDIPLLFEVKMTGLADRICVVWSPEKTRKMRLLKAGRFSPEDIRGRLRAQWPLLKKLRLADFVIDNSGGVSSTLAQTRKLYARLNAPEAAPDPSRRRFYRIPSWPTS